MSIDDLYGERSWLRGKISACEYKIEELEKQKKRLNKEIEDLKEDRRRINTIVENISKIKPLLSKADSNIIEAKDTIAGFLSVNKTDKWKAKLKLTSNLTRGIKTSFNSIETDGKDVIKKIDEEVKNKQNNLEDCERNIESTKDELRGYESDLDDVQWEIDHYYDDEE